MPGSDILISDSVKRAIIIETKVASVYDVVSTGLLCKIVQGFEIACKRRLDLQNISPTGAEFSSIIPRTSATQRIRTPPACTT